MGTHNILFYGELTKIILDLSSNTLFIYSTVNGWLSFNVLGKDGRIE